VAGRGLVEPREGVIAPRAIPYVVWTISDETTIPTGMHPSCGPSHAFPIWK
jgi:hypothetical protein